VTSVILALVAFAFGSPRQASRTPPDYDMFVREVPHPNAERRSRTSIVADIVGSVQVAIPSAPLAWQMSWEVFGVVVFTYHNTEAFWQQFEPHFLHFIVDGWIESLQGALLLIYSSSASPSFLFSLGDGRRVRRPSWQAAAVANLPAWLDGACALAGFMMERPSPDAFYEGFVSRCIGMFPLFGLEYWGKFLYGRLALIAPGCVDLLHFTIGGVGAATVLHRWGLRRIPAALPPAARTPRPRSTAGSTPRSTVQRQAMLLEQVRELRGLVGACFHDARIRGIRMACALAQLTTPTAYDLQVMLCETKRVDNMPARIAATRALLHTDHMTYHEFLEAVPDVSLEQSEASDDASDWVLGSDSSCDEDVWEVTTQDVQDVDPLAIAAEVEKRSRHTRTRASRKRQLEAADAMLLQWM